MNKYKEESQIVTDYIIDIITDKSSEKKEKSYAEIKSKDNTMFDSHNEPNKSKLKMLGNVIKNLIGRKNKN